MEFFVFMSIVIYLAIGIVSAVSISVDVDFNRPIKRGAWILFAFTIPISLIIFISIISITKSIGALNNSKLGKWLNGNFGE